MTGAVCWLMKECRALLCKIEHFQHKLTEMDGTMKQIEKKLTDNMNLQCGFPHFSKHNDEGKSCMV